MESANATRSRGRSPISTAAGTLPRGQRIDRPRLLPAQLFGTALQGLRTRRLRAELSALGIAIGIGAMVAVVGVSSSAQANLIAEIDALGTNLLTVTRARRFTGNTLSRPTRVRLRRLRRASGGSA